MKKILLCLALIIQLFSCSNNEDNSTNYNGLIGEYHLVKIESEFPVDYNSNSVFNTNLINEITCNSKLIFENDNVRWNFTSYDTDFLQYTIGTQGLTDYSSTTCTMTTINGNIIENDESVVRIQFHANDIKDCLKVGDTIKVKAHGSLIHQNGNHIVDEGLIEIEYSYLK